MAAIDTYTLSQLRTRIRSLLNEETALYWTDDELNRWINDAEREIAALALNIQNIDTATTVNGTRTVAFTGYKVEHVEYNAGGSGNIGLAKITPNQIGRLPVNAATIPQYWYEYGYSGYDKIGIDPLPSTTPGKDLNLYLADSPAAVLSGDSDVPTVPHESRLLIIFYVLKRAYEKEGKTGAAAQLGGMFKNEITHLIQDKYVFVPDGRMNVDRML